MQTMKNQLFIGILFLGLLGCSNPKVGNESVALATLDSIPANKPESQVAATDSATITQEEFADGWDVSPVFPAGAKDDNNAQLAVYITKQIPNLAQYSSIKGNIFVQLEISKKGEVKSATIIKGCDPKLDNEVAKVCKTLPPFTPATLKGKTVGVRLTFKLTFDGKSFS